MVGIVVLLSGGIDSTVLLYKLYHEYAGVVALSINYHQRHVKEMESARAIARDLNIPYTSLSLGQLAIVFQSWLVHRGTLKREVTPELTIVPNRNSILLNIAAAFAIRYGQNRIAFGGHGSDREVYPDCRWEFIEALEHSIRLGNNNPKFQIYAPFLNYNKSYIIRIGQELKVPFEKTWTCYRGNLIHCGTCPACVERKKAFKEAGVNDPIKYEK